MDLNKCGSLSLRNCDIRGGRPATPAPFSLEQAVEERECKSIERVITSPITRLHTYLRVHIHVRYA